MHQNVQSCGITALKRHKTHTLPLYNWLVFNCNIVIYALYHSARRYNSTVGKRSRVCPARYIQEIARSSPDQLIEQARACATIKKCTACSMNCTCSLMLCGNYFLVLVLLLLLSPAHLRISRRTRARFIGSCRDRNLRSANTRSLDHAQKTHTRTLNRKNAKGEQLKERAIVLCLGRVDLLNWAKVEKRDAMRPC